MAVVLKETRKKCNAARDQYFECLDRNFEDAEKCKEQMKAYEAECPATWVSS